MKKIYLIALASIFTTGLNAQNCDCTSEFEWLKTAFEENDAGFDFYLKQKGEANQKINY